LRNLARYLYFPKVMKIWDGPGQAVVVPFSASSQRGIPVIAALLRIILISFVLAFGAPALARGHGGGGHSSRSHSSSTSYGGGRHSESHGGYYAGGKGSSHKGGHYKNKATGDHYGKHR